MKESSERAAADKEGKDKPLTPEYAARLFFLSFRFSQGNTELQEMILDYIHFLHPQWRIDDQVRKEIEAKVAPAIKRYLLQEPRKFHIEAVSENGKDNIEEAIEEQVRYFLEIFQKSLGEDQWLNKEELLREVASEILSRDLHFLEQGRKRDNTNRITPATDKFLSHLCYYGFLGHSSGAEEYDQMFKDISSYFSEIKTSQENVPQVEDVRRVIKRWNETHPEEQINW